MLRTARKKIAASVAKIESLDDFSYSKFLRPALVEKVDVEDIYFDENTEEFPVEKLSSPLAVKIETDLPKISVLNISSELVTERAKAYLVFFGLTKLQLFSLKEDLLKTPRVDNYSMGVFKEIKIYDQSNIFVAHTPSLKTFSFTIDKAESHIFPMLTELPEVYDKLANLKAEVFNVKLLNVESFENIVVDTREFDVKDFHEPVITNIDVPDIENIKKEIVKSLNVPFENINLSKITNVSISDIDAAKISKIKIDVKKPGVKKVVTKHELKETQVIDVLNSKKYSENEKEVITSLLTAKTEIDWDDFVNQRKNLEDYEKEGARFLSEHDYCFFCDELGIPKYEQVLTAITYLQTCKKIKNVLLFSQSHKIKNGVLSAISGRVLNWESAVKKHANEISYKIISPENFNDDNSNANLNILDFDDLSKVELKDIIGDKKFDLLIFDDLDSLNSAPKFVDDMIMSLQPQSLWILSSIADAEFQKKYFSSFEFANKINFEFKGRIIEEVYKEQPHVDSNDIWLQMDEMQSFEYSEAMNQAKEELNKLLEAYNPLRFQSNIFTLIHKLKQTLNFSSFRNLSPKTNLLLSHIEAIAKNRKKVVVFTQYDENGIKKIEKALEGAEIKHYIGKIGQAPEDIKKNLTKFYERNEVAAFVTNLKPSKLKINLDKINYIINFDHWWNPIFIWQNEDELGLSDHVNKHLTIYNYLMRDTLEEYIYKLLRDKKLLARNLFDNLKSETYAEYINVNEWAELFDLNQRVLDTRLTLNNTKLENFKNYNIEDYKNIVKVFFNALGYREIDIMNINDSESFYITGNARRANKRVELKAKFINEQKVSLDDFEEVLSIKNPEKEIRRNIIITSGKYEGKALPDDIVLIDGETFNEYLSTCGLIHYV